MGWADELTEHNEQAVVRETRQTAEFQALQETLDEERSSYTVSIDQLKKKVEVPPPLALPPLALFI